MADWSALTDGFMRGSEFQQRRRANRQALEYRGRDLAALAGAEQDLMEQFPDETAGMTPYDSSIEDPFFFQLIKKFKQRKKKKTQAIDVGAQVPDSTIPMDQDLLPDSTIPEMGEEPEQQLADGGRVGYKDGGGLTPDDLERLNRQQARNARVEMAKDTVKEGARKAIDTGRKAAKYEGVAPKGTGFLKGAAGGAAAAAGIGGALDAGGTETEDYYTRLGTDSEGGRKFGEVVRHAIPFLRGVDAQFIGDIGARTAGVLTDIGARAADFVGLGDAARSRFPDKNGIELSDGVKADVAAGRHLAPEGSEQNPMQLSTTTISASPPRRGAGGGAAPAAKPENILDFAELDIDPKEVPNMQTDDWRKYRSMIIRDAARRGQPIDQVNERITQMQMKGFASYGLQGIALQKAGNVRGAMAAYRAAFQYFPNGYDVEFGTMPNKQTGQQQIVGFALDEKTGKLVPGSEVVMDPGNVSAIIANMQKPGAWNSWVKDNRDFQQTLREYEEVKKPLAEAQGSAALTNARANLMQGQGQLARAQGLGGLKQSDVRAAQEMFAEQIMMQGVTDQQQALELADIAIQLKQRHPETPETTIVRMVLQRAGVIQ